MSLHFPEAATALLHEACTDVAVCCVSCFAHLPLPHKLRSVLLFLVTEPAWNDRIADTGPLASAADSLYPPAAAIAKAASEPATAVAVGPRFCKASAGCSLRFS